MIGRARVVYGDGHSDYGTSLRKFEEIAGESLNHRSVVIVLGDARNNYREPRSDVLERVAEKAHRVFWLNPEPARWWDTGDSVTRAYAPTLTASTSAATCASSRRSSSASPEAGRQGFRPDLPGPHQART